MSYDIKYHKHVMKFLEKCEHHVAQRYVVIDRQILIYFYDADSRGDVYK